MTKNQSIVSYAAVFIVGLALGVGATYTAAEKSLSMGGANDSSYQAGFEAAKQRVEKSGAGMIFKMPDEIHDLSGTVTEVNGNRITIHLSGVDPFGDPVLDDRTVIVTGDTKIVKLSQKGARTIQSELREDKDNSGLPIAVESFIKEDALLSDIVVGDSVTVKAPDNIRTLKTFSVSEVRIMPSIKPVNVPVSASETMPFPSAQ